MGGGAGGGSGGGTVVGPTWVTLGAFGDPPSGGESIEGLRLAYANQRLHVSYRIGAVAYFNRTSNAISSVWTPQWVKSVVDTSASRPPDLFADRANGIFVGFCTAMGGSIVKLPMSGSLSLQQYSPCVTPMTAGPTQDLFYGLNVTSTAVQVSRSTTGGASWSPYTGGISLPNPVSQPKLFVKLNGNLVVSYVSVDKLIVQETGGMTWVPLGAGLQLPASLAHDVAIDGSGRPCAAFANAAGATIVQCYEAGTWVPLGGVAYSAAAPTKLDLAADGAGKMWLVLLTPGAVVLSLNGSTWTRAGPFNGCLTAACPSLAEVAIAHGPSDEPFIVTTSSGADDQPTLWRLE